MSTTVSSIVTEIPSSQGHRGLAPRLARGWATLRRWRQRARQRRMLAMLTEYELHDIGVSTADRYGELAKPFWRD